MAPSKLHSSPFQYNTVHTSATTRQSGSIDVQRSIALNSPNTATRENHQKLQPARHSERSVRWTK